MTATTLLDRLHGARRVGVDRWLARCPAHDDKRASLAVRELEDGRVLVHDFAGCSVADVLAAVGLNFESLFPPRSGNHRTPPERRPFPASDVLRAVDSEALIAAAAASFVANGGMLADVDRARLLLAAQRISQAVLESRNA